MTYITEVFNKRSHKREGFDCGNDSLNHYLLKQLSQDISKKVGMGYIYATSNEVIAYYTLQFAEVGKENYTSQTAKQVQYPTVPAFLIGRLAVDHRHKSKNIGASILLDALKRCQEYSQYAGGRYAIVDAINDDAKLFYEKYGFTSTQSDSMKLVISMKDINKILK